MKHPLTRFLLFGLAFVGGVSIASHQHCNTVCDQNAWGEGIEFNNLYVDKDHDGLFERKKSYVVQRSEIALVTFNRNLGQIYIYEKGQNQPSYRKSYKSFKQFALRDGGLKKEHLDCCYLVRQNKRSTQHPRKNDPAYQKTAIRFDAIESFNLRDQEILVPKLGWIGIQRDSAIAMKIRYDQYNLCGCPPSL